MTMPKIVFAYQRLEFPSVIVTPKNIVVMRILTCTIFLFLLTVNVFSQQLPQWSSAGNLVTLGSNPFISVVDSNVFWVAGGVSSPVIFRTVNGGTDWRLIPVTGLPFVLSGIAAKDDSTVFVCDYGGDSVNGGNAKIYKTTNTGSNWILIDSTGGTSGYFNGIQFSKSNPQFGIAFSNPPDGAGNPFFLLRTTNAGSNWVRQSPPGISGSTGTFYSLFTIDQLFYGFLAFNVNPGFINPYITNNGGSNWQFSQVNIPFQAQCGLAFSDDKQTGIIVGANIPEISRTTDGGITWNTVNTNSQISGFAGVTWISGTNTVFINADSNTDEQTILRSDDGGITWNSQTTTKTTGLRQIDYARYNNVIFAYCVAKKGEILRSRQTIQPTGISQLSNTIPGKFILKQNYPNPFNPVTNLEFEISDFGFVSLKIYDLQGKEIEELVNEVLSRGIYKYRFDATGLSSGIYFYRLTRNNYTETRTGKFTETKSMLLLK